MKASGVIAIAGGVGALALLGLMMLQRSEPVSDPAPTLAVDGRVPAAPSQQPVPGAPSPPPRAAVPMRPSQQAPAERPTPGAVEPGPAAEVEPASPVAPSSPPPVPAEVERRLTVARQSADESERLRAVKWLGEHADLYQFEALQQIQMNDPDEAVRRAAEAAANELRVRHADEPWPGIPQNADPQDYMRGVPEPSP